MSSNPQDELIKKFQDLQQDPLKNAQDIEKLLNSISLKQRIELKKNTIINYDLSKIGTIDPHRGSYGIVSFRRFTVYEANEILSSPIIIEAGKASKEGNPLSKEQLDDFFKFQNYMLSKILAGNSKMSEQELNDLGDQIFTGIVFAIAQKESGMLTDFLSIVIPTSQTKDSATD